MQENPISRMNVFKTAKSVSPQKNQGQGDGISLSNIE